MFKDLLYDLHIEHNKSKMDLSKEAAIPYTTICGWFNGRLPDYNAIIKLSEYFNVSADYLLEQSSEPTRNKKNSNSALPSERPKNSVAFVSEFQDILDDNNFINVSRLFQAAKTELRALALGYLIALFQQQGIDTKKILKY